MKYKILVGISLFLFTVVTISLVTAGLVYQELKKDKNNTTGTTQLDENGNVVTITETGTTAEVLTEALVAKHNIIADCWIIMSNKVYGVSEYLQTHPGGVAAIAPYCGKDATTAFNSKDKNPASSHSSFATNLVENYYIGDLGMAISDPTVSTQEGSTGTTTNDIVTTPTVSQDTVSPTVSSVTLTMAEISTHASVADCWIIMSGKVYVMTNYFVLHPGGTGAISPYCGKDATTAFQTQGGQGSHSSFASSLLPEYYIGDVGSTQSTTSIPSSSTTTTTTSGTTTNTDTSSTSSLPTAVITKYPDAIVVEQNVEDDGRQEIKITVNGQCVKVKVDATGKIVEEESC